jgi:5-methylcytosine-specific restriction endonuclease McrA
MSPIIRSGYAPRTTHRERGDHRKHWRTIRKQRLALDGYRCTIQLDGCTTTATTVHLHPALNNNHDLATLDNTQSACARCHGRVDGAGRGGVAPL